VIFGELPKYCDRRSEGGGGEINARQNECVVSRSVVLRVEDMTGGTSPQTSSKDGEADMLVVTALTVSDAREPFVC
jgi:hypothetical protein